MYFNISYQRIWDNFCKFIKRNLGKEDLNPNSLSQRAQEEDQESEQRKEENKQGQSANDEVQVDDVHVNFGGNKQTEHDQIALEEAKSPQVLDREIQQDLMNSERKIVKEMNLIRKFFFHIWSPLFKKIKFYALGFTAIWIIICTWRIFSFTEEFEEMRVLDNDHWLQEIQDSILNDYHNTQSTASVSISLIWGLKGLDKSKVSKWDPRDIGELVYDSDMNLSPVANQQKILHI